jgi:2-polyprenyl-6-methoxyphenol hydroxylase-like FAD-dependent oxidoreductase
MHQVIKTRVGIVGGGPAGMMLGLLLGRLGIATEGVFVVECSSAESFRRR